jgi:ABC-type transport system substrate-binding protein
MNTIRKGIIGAAIVGATVTGGAVGASLIGTASAQTSSTTAAPAATPSTATAPATGQAPSGQPGQRPANFDPSKGGHVANGITETLLTGDTATKVTAAATAAVPGATIQRVENDAEGATYEAHMQKADGSLVTVKLDASFKVTSIEDGMK